jgi:hypothetical protein
MRAGIERRIRALEAERGPATIQTLRDYVVWLANREEGEERPPMDPELEAVLFNFARGWGKMIAKLGRRLADLEAVES